MKLSRSTRSPGMTGTVRENMGPAKAKVWNSPRSPQGSTSAGRSARRLASKVRPGEERAGGGGGEEAGVEGTAGERRAERARVNASEMRSQTCRDHLAGEFGGSDSQVRRPDRKDGLEACAVQLFYAVGADVLAEEVAKSNSIKAISGGASADLGHARLVVGVGAGEGKVDLPERQAHGGGLPVEEFF